MGLGPITLVREYKDVLGGLDP